MSGKKGRKSESESDLGSDSSSELSLSESEDEAPKKKLTKIDQKSKAKSVVQNDSDSLPDDSDEEVETKKKPKPSPKKPSSQKLNTQQSVVSKPAVPQSSRSIPTSSSSSSSSTTQSTPSPSFSIPNYEVDITKGPDIASEAAARKLVLKYMYQQNRPYSAIQIHDNLHKRIPKSVLEKVLATITSSQYHQQQQQQFEEPSFTFHSSSSSTTTTNNDPSSYVSIIAKEYGKTKIFYPDQRSLSRIQQKNYTQQGGGGAGGGAGGGGGLSESDLHRIDQEALRLEREVSAKKQQEHSLQENLSQLTSQPTDTEIDRVLAELETRVREKSSRAGAISSLPPPDPQALPKAIRKHNFYRSVWRERKTGCLEAVNMVSEGMGKNMKQTMAEMGVEGDEEYDAVLPPLIPEPKS